MGPNHLLSNSSRVEFSNLELESSRVFKSRTRSSRVFRLELRTGDQVFNAELKLFALCRHALLHIVNIYYIICSQNPRARSSPPNQPDRTPPHPLLQPPSLPQPRPHPHHRGRRPRGCRWANTKTCFKNILNSFHIYVTGFFLFKKCKKCLTLKKSGDPIPIFVPLSDGRSGLLLSHGLVLVLVLGDALFAGLATAATAAATAAAAGGQQQQRQRRRRRREQQQRGARRRDTVSDIFQKKKKAKKNPYPPNCNC